MIHLFYVCKACDEYRTFFFKLFVFQVPVDRNLEVYISKQLKVYSDGIDFNEEATVWSIAIIL